MGLTEIKTVTGGVNTSEAAVLENVRAALRRQLPQVRPYQPQGTPVAVVGGGPSLAQTVDELRDLVFGGMKVCAVNGAYQWLIDRNIKPDLAVVLDAREANAAFLRTPVPGCKYLVASQCHPAMFDTLEGRDAYLWHAISYDTQETDILEAFYGADHFWPVTGGSTVTLRALSVLRMIGFCRMDLFGFDSCWMGENHHAFPQAMNDTDQRIRVEMRAAGQPTREFWCAPWHLKQWEDFQMLIKARGSLFALHVHGDGLIAHGMRTGARIHLDKKERISA